jgi:hypothetical protein
MKFVIKDFWWEGSTFVIETKCGQRHEFEGAYVSDVNYSYAEDNGVQVERVKDVQKETA